VVATDKKELEFYRSLSVDRKDWIDAVDNGSTANKLHDLWEDRKRLEWLLDFLRENMGIPYDREAIDAAMQSDD
jgi:hypothetical protein